MVLFIIMAGIVGIAAWSFVPIYRETPGTVWDRLLAASKGSATILWARFVVVVSAITTGFVSIADYLNAPGVADSIRSAVKPEYVGPVMIAVMLISEFARRRTLKD